MNIKNPLNTRASNRPRLLRAMAAPLVAAIMMALPSASFAGIYVSVNFAPPPLPVYEQPPIPGDGYLWTPGYWAYSDDGYFWVPGTWVEVPYRGALWTPGYWDYSDEGDYAFHDGYWGDHIGFYGGVDYGYGYGGEGYEGGYWNNGALYYNRSVNNISITNVKIYNKTVINNTTINNTTINNTTINKASFHGPGGSTARPTAQDQLAEREKHTKPVPSQQRQIAMASQNKESFAAVNHGAPPIAATQKPGAFAGAGIVKAHPVSPEARAAVDKAIQAKPVLAKPVGAPGKPMMGENNSGPAKAGPNAPKSAGFAPKAHAPAAATQPERAGPMANPQDGSQGNPKAPRSASYAPRAHDRQSMPPLRDGPPMNARDRQSMPPLRDGPPMNARDEAKPMAHPNRDTAEPMQPERNGPPVNRRQVPQSDPANNAPRNRDAAQPMPTYRDGPMQRAERPVDSSQQQPMRGPAPAHAPRPEPQPKPDAREKPSKQPVDPKVKDDTDEKKQQ